MSIKAALKAGLGATDSQSIDGNNNFNSLLKKAVSFIRELLRFIFIKSQKGPNGPF